MESGQPVHTLRDWRLTVYSESQAEFATRLGVDPSALSLWESGNRSPHPKTKRLIAERLGIQPSQITWPEPIRKESPVAA